MDLDLERIAFGTVVGVTGATVAPGTGRECNQKINFGKKFDEISGPNGARFHKVLMRVARIASAHEYVHHVVNVNLGVALNRWQRRLGGHAQKAQARAGVG